MVLTEDPSPLARLEGMTTTHPPTTPRATAAAETRLAPPSGLPRRLVLVGTVIALAGIAALTATLVAGVLVGFGDPAASGDLTPPLPLGFGLTFVGAAIANVGLLFARADGRPR
jgi:hypothetical protein